MDHMARTKQLPKVVSPSGGGRDHDTEDDSDDHPDHPKRMKQEEGCRRRRRRPSPYSSDEEIRRNAYDDAAVLRADAKRALKAAFLAAKEASQALDHAAHTADLAFNAEVDASNAARRSFANMRRHGSSTSNRQCGGGV
jgi:hypothetical protein